MQDVSAVLARLRHSAFRSRFRLPRKELDYLHLKGFPIVIEHAAQFIEKRLAPAAPTNDGKQTPWRGHPVFIAQHATATCCRGCLEKWHHIPRGHKLSPTEQEYVVQVIEAWLHEQAP